PGHARPHPRGRAVTRPYPLSNLHRSAEPHHQALSQLLDPWTRNRIRGLLPDLTGVRCLEVGAGAGSVARWLADQVGDGGQVVALDKDPDLVPSHPRIVKVTHDLTNLHEWPDEAAGPFGLVHARLTLHHLPNRRDILTRLAQLLGPGGVLLVQDWAGRTRFVASAPTPEDGALVD